MSPSDCRKRHDDRHHALRRWEPQRLIHLTLAIDSRSAFRTAFGAWIARHLLWWRRMRPAARHGRSERSGDRRIGSASGTARRVPSVRFHLSSPDRSGGLTTLHASRPTLKPAPANGAVCTIANRFSAMPLGRLASASHFSTEFSLALRQCAMPLSDASKLDFLNEFQGLPSIMRVVSRRSSACITTLRRSPVSSKASNFLRRSAADARKARRWIQAERTIRH